MKFIAKIISDNGYKIELIRPLRDIPFQLGASVEISLTLKQVDLINTFNNLLDDETKNMILDKFNEARTPAKPDPEDSYKLIGDMPGVPAKPTPKLYKNK